MASASLHDIEESLTECQGNFEAEISRLQMNNAAKKAEIKRIQEDNKMRRTRIAQRKEKIKMMKKETQDVKKTNSDMKLQYDRLVAKRNILSKQVEVQSQAIQVIQSTNRNDSLEMEYLVQKKSEMNAAHTKKLYDVRMSRLQLEKKMKEMKSEEETNKAVWDSEIMSLKEKILVSEGRNLKLAGAKEEAKTRLEDLCSSLNNLEIKVDAANERAFGFKEKLSKCETALKYDPEIKLAIKRRIDELEAKGKEANRATESLRLESSRNKQDLDMKKSAYEKVTGDIGRTEAKLIESVKTCGEYEKLIRGKTAPECFSHAKINHQGALQNLEKVEKTLKSQPKLQEINEAIKAATAEKLQLNRKIDSINAKKKILDAGRVEKEKLQQEIRNAEMSEEQRENDITKSLIESNQKLDEEIRNLKAELDNILENLNASPQGDFIQSQHKHELEEKLNRQKNLDFEIKQLEKEIDEVSREAEQLENAAPMVTTKKAKRYLVSPRKPFDDELSDDDLFNW